MAAAIYSSSRAYSNAFIKSLTASNVMRTGSSVLGSIKELIPEITSAVFLGATGSFAGLVTGPGIVYWTSVETLPTARKNYLKACEEAGMLTQGAFYEWLPIAQVVGCVGQAVLEVLDAKPFDLEQIEKNKIAYTEKLVVADQECFRIVGLSQMLTATMTVFSEMGILSLEVLKMTVLGLGIAYVIQGCIKMAHGIRNYYETYKFRSKFNLFLEEFKSNQTEDLWNHSEFKQLLEKAETKLEFSSRVMDPAYLKEKRVKTAVNIEEIRELLDRVSEAIEAQNTKNLTTIFTGFLLVIGGSCLIAADILSSGHSTAALSFVSAIFLFVVVFLSYKPIIDLGVRYGVSQIHIPINWSFFKDGSI